MTMPRTGWIPLCLLVLALAGCEEDVLPPPPHEYPFTLYGVLDPYSDVQRIRVFPVEATLDPGTAGPLDARFTSRDLATGEEHVWRDSVFVDSTGVVGHVFYARFRAEHEHTYRLEVARSDGAASHVEVHVPEQTQLLFEPPDTLFNVRVPARLVGDPPSLLQTEMVYVVQYVSLVVPRPPPSPSVTYCDEITYHIPYQQALSRTADGWRVVVDLERDRLHLAGAIAGEPDYQTYGGTFGVLNATFTTLVANAEWDPPGGVFDPRVLVQPGVMDNVENGFGFVGGGYQHGRSISDAGVLQKAGFAIGNPFCERNRPPREVVLEPWTPPR